MSKLTGEKEVDAMPILAVAALQNAAGGDDRLKELLLALVEDTMEKRNKEKAKRERVAMNAVQAAAEEKRVKEQQMRHCNHRKQDDTTRLAGQRLSSGQISLVCTACGKEYFYPARAGQEQPPNALMPPMDQIGG